MKKLKKRPVKHSLPPRLRAWRKFHHDNPLMWKTFVKLAEEALNVGVKVGARQIGENIRWKVMIATRSNDKYKLCNNHIPYYARLLMLTDKRFENYFEKRDMKFDATDEQIIRYGKLQIPRRKK